ncbi:hypothetical protein KIPE111705_43970 [Kibdelosporangium persicum]
MNKNAVRPGRTPPVTTDVSPAASAVRPVRNSSAVVPSTTARRSSAVRVVARDRPTSTGSPSTVSNREAWSRSASSVRPESTHGTTTGACTARGASGTSGACSRMTCAFVPLMPNDDTPARRARPVSGHCLASVSRVTSPAVQSTCGDSSAACNVRGSTPCRIASTILMMPATPAAACVWPMFDLIDPRYSGSSRSWPYVVNRACASIGSPSCVPVPCASTTSMSDVDRPALASACRMTRCCEGPFGAVNPFDAPSWLTAEPFTTARIRWPLRWASDSRSSTTMPTPSDQPVPSASAENDLQRPSAARPRCREKSMNVFGVDMTVTPPANAREHSPDRNACIAQCRATRDEEHAVSIETAGPSRPRVYATRPDSTLPEVPMPMNPSAPSGSLPTLAP